MDHAVHIKRLQDHAEDQARIIRGKNHTIKALRAQNSNLWCELQSRPETPSEALIERAEKAEEGLREARIALSSWEYSVEQRLDHARKEAAGEWAGRLERTEMQLRVARERAYARQREAAEARVRATEAERERDEATRALGEALDSHDETLRNIAEGKYAAEPRPLTPDAITDEMVYRGLSAYYDIEPTTERWDGDRAEDFRRALTAALTEPPKRPEGAEELETVIGLNAGKWTSGAEDVRALADLLASQGVRATGGN